MILQTVNTGLEPFRDALEGAGWRVKERDCGREGAMSLIARNAPAIGATVDDGWLLLETTVDVKTPAPDRSAGLDLWGLLNESRSLPPGAKVAIPWGSGRTVLRDEIPLECFADPSARLAQGASDISIAHDRLLDGSGGSDARPAQATLPESAADREEAAHLARLCAEAGWAATQRENGTVAVTLEVGEAYYQAHVAAVPNGGVSVLVELGSVAATSDASREALALFLLICAAAVRMVRPFLGSGEGCFRVGFEVVGASWPSPGWLDHAFAALSVVCRIAGREVTALADDRVATGFLKTCGGTA
jgi:hypothetical protein